MVDYFSDNVIVINFIRIPRHKRIWWKKDVTLQRKKFTFLPFPSSFSPEALETHGSFTWLGQTQYKLQLKSQETHSLQLKACFVHTGVYNLGTPRVFAKLSDQVTVFETSQQNSMPALIIINNAWQPRVTDSVWLCGVGFTTAFEIPNLFRKFSDHCKTQGLGT